MVSVPPPAKAALPALAAATFVTALGLGMLVPAFPLLTAGEPQTVLGLLVSAFGAARLLVSLPSGLAVDRLGLRPVAAAGIVLLFAGSLLGAGGFGFAGLLGAIALQGAGSAVFATAAMSAMALAAGPHDRAKAMSWFQGALLFSFALGPVAGGYVVALFGPLSPFVVQAGLCLPALAMLPLFAAGRGPARAAGLVGGLAGPILSRGLVGGSSMAFAGFFVRAVISWVLAPVLAVTLLKLTPDRLGLIIGAATLANLAVLPLNAHLIARFGAPRAIAAALLVTVLGLVVLPLSLSEPSLWLALVLILSGTGAMMPSASVLALEGVRPDRIDRAMGLFRTVGDIGMAVGPTAVTVLAGLIGGGYQIGFLVTLGAVALCLVLFAASRLVPAR